MASKITFKKVKLKKQRKGIEFTWDKILLLALVGAFILFYIFMSVLNSVNIDSIGRAISEGQDQGNSVQTADIRFAIEITNAEHLDSEKNFIRDITKEVKYLDNVWSQPISDGEYVRVVFEQPLTSDRDIKIYPRIISGNPRIEVYEKDGTELIAEFTSLVSNDYNQVFLTNLQNSQDTFDLKVIGGSVEFEHVIDPHLSQLTISGTTELCGNEARYDKIVITSTGILQVCARNATANTGWLNITLGPAGNFTVEPGGLIKGDGRGGAGGAGIISTTVAATQGENGEIWATGTASVDSNGGGGGGGKKDNAADSAGGGGGGFGGLGGKGGNTTLSTGEVGGGFGKTYGSTNNLTLVGGSGGGGGSGDGATAGSAGGAGLKINAGLGVININGAINLTGAPGVDDTGTNDRAGGGGGGGGHLILYGASINLNSASINISGGRGGNTAAGTDDAGGGGGGGGRIYIVYSTISNTSITTSAAGGIAGASGAGSAPVAGSAGTVTYNSTATTFTDNRPKWQNPEVNNTSPFAGEIVSHNVLWTDDGELSLAVLEVNGTGASCDTVGNVSSTGIAGSSNWSNLTWQIPSACSGKAIGWRQWGFDFPNNQSNVTATQVYVVQVVVDNAPKWQFPSTNDTNPLPNTAVRHNVNWTDDTALSFAILEVNGTGASCFTSANVSETTISGTSSWANLTWLVPNACEGQAIGWKQWANDSLNQGNLTSTQVYEVQNINPTTLFGTNPVDALNSNSNSITFEFKTSDNLNVDALRLYGNWSGTWEINQTNMTAVNDSYWNITVAGIPEGKGHVWAGWGNDTIGNFDFTDTNRTFTVDTVAPVITLPVYTNGTVKKNTDTLILNISVTDVTTTPQTCLIDVTGTNQTIAFSGGWCNGTISLTGLSDGDKVLKVWANDSVNNFGLNNSYVVKIDSTNPTVTLPVYTNATKKKSSDSLILNISVTDANTVGTSCLVNVAGQGSNTTISYSSGWCNGTISLTGSSQGNSTINAYANDSAGNFGLNNSYVVWIDDTAPVVTLPVYTNATKLRNTDSMIFNISVSDSGVGASYCSINVAGNANQTVAVSSGWCNGTYALTGIADGNQTINAYANDTVGNLALNNSYVVQMDSTAPTITLPVYTNATVRRNDQLLILNISVADSGVGVDRCTINVATSSTGNITVIPSSGWCNTTYSLAGASNGNQTINAYANDTLGNLALNNSYVVQIDSTAPTSTINQPSNNSLTNDNTPGINITMTDNIDSSITYNIYVDGAINKTGSVSNNTATNVTLDAQPDGLKLIIAEAVDDAGNRVNSSTLFLRIDTTAPTTNYVSPTENSGVFRSRNYIEINVTATDTNLDKIIIRLYNSSSIQINSSTTSTSPNFINFTGLADGLYFYNATANDSAGNTANLETRNITLDTTNPLIEYTTGTPANNANLSQNFIFVNVTASDTNFANITYRLFNSTSQVNVTTYTTLITNINWTSLPNQVYTYNVTVVDKATNTNSTATRTVTLDTTNPLIEFTTGTEANATSFNRNWIFANVSITETNFKNVTFKLFNSTGLLNQTTYTALTTTINWTDLLNTDVQYWYNVSTYDWTGNFNQTETRYITLTQDNPPKWQNVFVDDSTPNPNQAVVHSVNWTDGTALSYATLEINSTGASCNTLANITSKTISGTVNQTNLTWTVENACEGKLIGWRMYANDSANQWNVTATQEYTVNNINPLASFGTNPVDNFNTSTSSVFFQLKGSDNLGVSFLRLYTNATGTFTFNQTNSSPVNDTIWEVDVDDFPEGKYVWAVWVNDTSVNGNQDFTDTNRTFTVDLTQPTSTINQPANDTYTTDNTPDINITMTDNFDTLITFKIYVNGVINKTGSVSNNTATNVTLDQQPDGLKKIIAEATDDVGRKTNSSILFLTIDTINPLIAFIAPTEANNTNFSRTWIFANVSLNETNFKNVTFKLFNSTGLLNQTTYTALATTINWTGLLNTNVQYWYNVSTYDQVSNFNQTETRYITLTQDNPPTVTILYPENTTYNVNVSQLNYTATDDVSLSACWFSTDGGATNSSPDFAPCANFSGLISNEGSNNWTVYANDSLNQVGSDIVFFTKDTINPSIQFVSPTENSGVFRNRNYIEVNVTATDSNLDKITIRLYNSTGQEIRNNISSTSPFYINYSSLAEGIYFYNSTANDTAGNSNSTETRNITLDRTNPLIDYTTGTPANNANLSQNFIFVNVTASDTNFANITYKLFNSTGQVNVTTYTTEIKNINFTSLPNGVYTYNVTIVDKAVNSNSTATRTVTLDTVSPNIQFVSPTETNNSQLTRNYIQVNVTASDTNLGTITLKLYNSTSLVQTNTSASSPLFVNFTNLPDENYRFNATVNDTSGNTNQTETRLVTTDTGAPTVNYVTPTETNNTYLNRNYIQINVTASDPNLHKIIIRLYNSSSIQINSSTTSTSPNFINFTGLGEGNYSFNATANDTFGNANSLGTRTVVLDTTNPSITNIAESPSDPATYVSGATYRFNATITDTNLQTVIISFDSANYTPGNVFGGGIYNFTISDLAAGVHNYYWYANDSAANVNTSVQTYTINNATGNITLLINGSASNQVGTYGVQTNASASTLFGTVSLFRNGTGVTSQNNVFVTLAANFYNYTAVSSGDQNHSSASTTLFVTISKAQSVVNLTLNVTDGNVTIVQDSSIFLNVTQVTGDSGATLQLYRAGTKINEGASPLSNFTTFNTQGLFNITGFYVGSENYTGGFETWFVNVTETPDTTAPSVTNLTESPSDPATYSPGQRYEFNATVTDNRGISIVRIDFNGTNYTTTNLSADRYNFTISDLAVGVYNYRWYANDTVGNINSTMNGTYTIDKNTTSLTLAITPSASVTYPTETTALGSNCPSQLTCTLYRNSVSVSNPNIATLAAATYNYTYNTTGNANYTFDSESTNLVVNQNTEALWVVFNTTSPITYPQVFTVYSNASSSFTLYRNGTSITNNSVQELGAGAYNFTVTRTDNVNYSDSYDERQFVVSKGTGLVFTYLNNSRANITIEQQTLIYLNGTLETGVGNIKLYNNGTIINQETSPLSNLTNFTTIGLFNITTIYGGNENYTSDFETWYVNVTELDVTPPQISILHPQNISYNSVRTQLNYTATDNFALDKCWYSTDLGATNVTITCGQNVTGLSSGEGSSTWKVYANDTKGNQNSSSVTFFVDSINPTASFVNPTETNGSTLGRTFIQVNVTATDTNLQNITIRLFNSTGSQIRSNVSTSPFFINYTGLVEGNYSFNATANDTLNNLGSTETRTVSLVKPTINITRPENKTYITSTNIRLNFTASLQGFVWYNIDQGSNTTIIGNTTFNTTNGQHTLYLFANNTVGETSKNVTFTVNTSRLIIHYNNYSGSTRGVSTDFNASAYEDLQDLSGVVLENTDSGKISFNQAINLTNDSTPGDNILDLDSNTNISDNSIVINTTAIPNFNKSATLSLYNLVFTDPRVLRDGSVCSSTICTEVSYSAGVFIFNVTQFTNYSAEETPSEAAPPAGGGGEEAGAGGGLRQCVNNSQCGEFENCVNGFCIKLFDIKIIDFQSPATLGEFFEFTYLIKAVANINNDVVVSFWIENQAGEKVSSGSDTIYLGSYDEKTEETKIFLPSSFESGVYNFVIEVSYEGYHAKSQRTIEIQVKEGTITITPVDIGGLKTLVIVALALLALIVFAFIIYRERKKIERSIAFGFSLETRFFRRHKTSILTFLLIVIAGLLLYLLGFYEFLALKLSEAILWFKIYSKYVYYVLLGLIIVIVIWNIARSKGARDKFHDFHEWRKRRRIENFFRRKYSAGVREAERQLSGAEGEISKEFTGFTDLINRLFSKISSLAHKIEKSTIRGIKKTGGEISDMISESEKKTRKIKTVPEKETHKKTFLKKEVSAFFSGFGHDIKSTSEKAKRAFGKIKRFFRREAKETRKKMGAGIREAEKGIEKIGEDFEKAKGNLEKKERAFMKKLLARAMFLVPKIDHVEAKKIEKIEKEIPKISSKLEEKIWIRKKVKEDLAKLISILKKLFKKAGSGIKRLSGKAGRLFKKEIEAVPREIGKAERFVLKEKRGIGKESVIVAKTAERAIDSVYSNVAGLLSRTFGKETRKIVAEDFEKHFIKHNKRILRRHLRTIEDIIKIKEEVISKKASRLSHEFESHIRKTRKNAALLISDLADYLKENSQILAEKERKRVEETARLYEKEISFIKKIPRKTRLILKETDNALYDSYNSIKENYNSFKRRVKGFFGKIEESAEQNLEKIEETTKRDAKKIKRFFRKEREKVAAGAEAIESAPDKIEKKIKRSISKKIERKKIAGQGIKEILDEMPKKKTKTTGEIDTKEELDTALDKMEKDKKDGS